MCGAIPPFPHVLMACCLIKHRLHLHGVVYLVKHRRNFNFYIIHDLKKYCGRPINNKEKEEKDVA
jgi:hypothetical protein